MPTHLQPLSCAIHSLRYRRGDMSSRSNMSNMTSQRSQRSSATPTPRGQEQAAQEIATLALELQSMFVKGPERNAEV